MRSAYPPNVIASCALRRSARSPSAPGSPRTFSSVCVIPLGHWISIRLDRLRAAQPEVHAVVARRGIPDGRRHVVPLRARAARARRCPRGCSPGRPDAARSTRSACSLTLCSSSGRSPSTLTTRSSRPSLSKSPTPMPRFARATAKSAPACADTSWNLPFTFRKTAFGCRYVADSNSSMRSLACEFAVTRSLNPSLSKSASALPHPLRRMLRRAEPARVGHVTEERAVVVLEERKRLAGERRDVEVGPAVVVVVPEVHAHARDRPAVRRHRHAGEQARPPRTCRCRGCGTGSPGSRRSSRTRR